MIATGRVYKAKAKVIEPNILFSLNSPITVWRSMRNFSPSLISLDLQLLFGSPQATLKATSESTARLSAASQAAPDLARLACLAGLASLAGVAGVVPAGEVGRPTSRRVKNILYPKCSQKSLENLSKCSQNTQTTQFKKKMLSKAAFFRWGGGLLLPHCQPWQDTGQGDLR